MIETALTTPSGRDVPCVSRHLAKLGATVGAVTAGHARLLRQLRRGGARNATLSLPHGLYRLASAFLLFRSVQ